MCKNDPIFRSLTVVSVLSLKVGESAEAGDRNGAVMVLNENDGVVFCVFQSNDSCLFQVEMGICKVINMMESCYSCMSHDQMCCVNIWMQYSIDQTGGLQGRGRSREEANLLPTTTKTYLFLAPTSSLLVGLPKYRC